MSFSAKVKGEICRYTDISKEEALAELSAIMKGSGTIGFSGKGLSFRITTENPASARHIFTILKEHFDIHSKLMVKKSNSLKKNNIYMVLIDEEMGVRDLLQETGIFKEIDGVLTIDYKIDPEMVKTEEYKKAYIRGAFIGGGSVTNPEKTYHLEFVTHSEEYAIDLCKLINSFGLNSKVIQRKNSFIIYIKEGEQIVDLLNIVGAHTSLLELENIRIAIGNSEKRIPKDISMYVLNDYIDGTEENSSYEKYISNRNSEGLLLINKKHFESIITEPTWFEIK